MHTCLLGENLIISEKNQRYLYTQTDVTIFYFISAISFNQFAPTCQQEQHL